MKIEVTQQHKGLNRGNETRMTAEGSTSELPANILLRAMARVRSWFEVPFGYEDETGFHYGHEPLPVQAAAPREPFREVFTDRACDSAMFMAGTDKQTAPKPQPEVQSEVREQTVKGS